MHDIKVIDKLLPESFQNRLEEMLTDGYFPYYYDAETKVQSNEFDVGQFIHNFFINNAKSSWWLEIQPIFYFLEYNYNIVFKNVLRAKANFLLPYHRQEPHPLHIDINDDRYYSLIYYVNDSDGDTVFYKDFSKKVTPTQGRAVFFRSNIPHASSSPLFSKNRIVINLVGELNLDRINL